MGRAITRSVPLNAWTLQRFGLSPAKLPYRVFDPGAPRVFCVSIPKSGTHLLERALCLHRKLYRKLLPTVSDENIGRWDGLDGLLARLRPGQVVVSHLRFRSEYPAVLERSSVRPIFLIRDPHDIVVSQVHYLSKRTDHRLHRLFAGLRDEKAKLRLAIVGDPAHGVPSIGERLDRFAGWLDAGLVVRFEDLVGPDGGGDRARQLGALKAVYDFVGMCVDGATIGSIGDRLFSSDSPTFRRGVVGGWRRSFDPELVELFDGEVGDRIALYGYGSTGEA